MRGPLHALDKHVDLKTARIQLRGAA